MGGLRGGRKFSVQGYSALWLERWRSCIEKVDGALLSQAQHRRAHALSPQITNPDEEDMNTVASDLAQVAMETDDASDEVGLAM